MLGICKGSFGFVGVVLENNAHSNEHRIVEFKDKTITEIKRHKAIRITMSKGLFGFDVINNRKLIY